MANSHSLLHSKHPDTLNLQNVGRKQSRLCARTVCSSQMRLVKIAGATLYPERTLHMSESCLTLDIYVPQKTRDAAAVMVYLHGGSLVEGSSTAIQSGYFAVSNMTRENVISVSVNYRVAILGFLSVEALTDPTKENPEANFGLFDVIEALRWSKTT